MSEGIIGLNGEQLTPEQQSVENIKQSVLTIEGLFFAINNSNGFPLRVAEAALKGMGMLQKMHDELLKQLGPEEEKKFREQFKSNKSMPTANSIPA